VNGICERGDNLTLDESSVYCTSALERGVPSSARAICAKNSSR
jgi:hypothetical protein